MRVLKSITSIAIASIVLQGVTPIAGVLAESTNLISNPSAEASQTNSTAPIDWQTGNWGNNQAAFTYLRSGHDGSRAMQVTLSRYSDGDAKWYFKPVAVQAGASYNFSDYYQSSVPSYLVAALTDATGNTSYLDVKTLPASTAWAQSRTSLTVPSNAKTMTMYHLIQSNGTLVTDTFALSLMPTSAPNPTPSPTPPQPPTSDNIVPNPSLETATNAGQPSNWISAGWGANDAKYTYLNNGHSGNHSAKVQIANYTDGDAKWTFAPQAVSGGQRYLFSDWYKSTVQSDVVVEATMKDGSIQYLTIGHLARNNSWTQFSGYVWLPPETAQATVFHLIAGVGALTIDDVRFLLSAPAGFNRGLVSLTFDDGWASQANYGLAILNQFQDKGTFYLVSSFLNTPGYVTTAQAKAIQESGNDLGSHSVDHRDLTTLYNSQIKAELKNSQAALQTQFGGAISDFATPYGAYNASIISLIKTTYRSHRSTDVGFNSKDAFDVYNIKTQNVDINTTQAQVESWLAQAARERTWLVLVFHEVNPNMAAAGQYNTTPEQLTADLNAIQASGLSVLTVNQALAELQPQTQ